MTTRDDTAPATKGDLKQLERSTRADLKQEIARLEQVTKADINRLEKRLDTHDEQFAMLAKFMADEKEERKQERQQEKMETEQMFQRHLDVLAEDLRHDLMGANKDEMENLKIKVDRHDRYLKTQGMPASF